jgi:4-amino-4-deoxy-L-arabinose transferase-like glycosyltransferase
VSATALPTSAGRREGRPGPSVSAVRHRVPLGAWIALVAILNAACWSILTPAFQVSDEPSHVAYVKQLAETGEPPRIAAGAISREESIALDELRFWQVGGEAGPRTIASPAEQNQMQLVLARAAQLPRDGSESAGVATSQPPLYYAIEAIPYLIADSGTLLDRLDLMRLVSALMAGFTALFVFLFVREALPAEPWAWIAAGFGTALTPLLGFMSGAVNPDAMLFAVSAALFFCLARAFRHGLTRKRAVGIGLVVAAGLLTKLNFVGLLPGAFLGILVLAMRVARPAKSMAWRRLAIVLLIALGPALLVVLVAVSARSSGSHDATESLLGFVRRGSLLAKFGYIWQFYLPRLPGMASDFAGISTARRIWFDGFVGLYGWGDTAFPGWVYDVALLPAGAIACLCVAALARVRHALRSRSAEICVYALMVLGVLAMIGVASYEVFPRAGAEFAQVRYLLPLLALFGAALTLAARGAGRRWGPAAGVLIVVLMLAHDIFSQLLVVAHYYG